jgi:hypothetical protein
MKYYSFAKYELLEILQEKGVFSVFNKIVKVILTLNNSVKNSFNHGFSPHRKPQHKRGSFSKRTFNIDFSMMGVNN